MAILIDPFNRSIKQVETSACIGLQEMYDHLDCSTIEIAPVRLDNTDALIVDESGLLKDNQMFFQFDGQAFAGKGLLVGTNEEGDMTRCMSDLDSIIEKVRFQSPLTLVT